jgi:hypothetical protein
MAKSIGVTKLLVTDGNTQATLAIAKAPETERCGVFVGVAKIVGEKEKHRKKRVKNSYSIYRD